MAKAELILDARATLGEGPSWDAGRGLLHWVDILAGRIHHFNPADGTDEFAEVGQYVGAAVPDESGGMVLAARHGFYRYDPAARSLEPLGDPEAGLPDNRFNDGKCDPKGRFWAGTMQMEDAPGAGALYCLHPDRRIEAALHSVTCSNGIAWSPDFQTMYYIDSPTKRVMAYDFDLETGRLGQRRTAVVIPDGEGVPDGMTSDCEGCLWVAQWDGWCVSRWNPATGERLERIEVPVAKVTSCVFGGPDLTELYITTARVGLGDATPADQPAAGGLFRYRAGVRGAPTYFYAGGKAAGQAE